ncbi:ABC transporter ATP-binding protein [Tianweitania populi]|uniref:Aliphatic sulfonates import ATP-binding protein SsuB 1 n=1 Tax=Tianweitania populi TaxID=1607949 RepID=A0A8J3GM56_9HYPH|nr:ABC transporter ATP-binding protein [Tianweitania populi]GHD20931.1 aliphatic sulfonates import ATP-binding protein SsuB 1 [Tianweitania populi]
MSALVDIQGLSRSFGRSPVLDRIDLRIEAGEFVALLGRSGSGKSTLLRVLAGLDEADAGRVTLPKRRSIVFQEPRLMPWKSVAANIALGVPNARASGAVALALDDVELSHRSEAWPLTLSGGEAQRAALARALVREPELLLLDEPFASLDALTRLRMQGLVRELWRKHQPAVLLVTHDVWEAVTLADRILVLEDGRFRREVHVALNHPRRRTDPHAAALEAELLAELGVEQADHHQHHNPHSERIEP